MNRPRCYDSRVIDFLFTLPFTSGPVHDLGMMLVLLYVACVGAVYWVATREGGHPALGLLMLFAIIGGLSGWGFLIALAWARYGRRPRRQ